jgi:hypothetical protein
VRKALRLPIGEPAFRYGGMLKRCENVNIFNMINMVAAAWWLTVSAGARGSLAASATGAW